MPDDVAQTKLVFDATGAKSGSDAFQQAADKIIAANAAVGASFEKSTQRVVTSTSAQTAALDRIAKSFDPFIAATSRAQRQVEILQDIMAKGSLAGASTREIEQATRATDLMTQAINRLNIAQANQTAGFDVAARVTQLTAKFAPAIASAQAMGAELAQLNQAVQLGVSIEGGYSAAWDRIVVKYDEGAQSAARLAAAQRDLVEQARAAQGVLNSQANVNTLTGVRSPASGQAARSAAIFEEAFAQEARDAADLASGLAAVEAATASTQAEFARLLAIFDPTTLSVQRMAAELADLNAAQAAGVNIAGGYTAAQQRIVDSYDQGAIAARAAADADRALQAQYRDAAAQGRASFSTDQNQLAFSRFMGVGDAARSAHGAASTLPPGPGSAAASAAVFQEQFDAEEKLAAENARLMATYPSLASATAAHQKVLDDLTLAVSRNLMTEQEAQTVRDKSAANLANFGKGVKGVGENAWATRFATQQLGVQTIQFFSSIQAGQPILTAFIQQGHQVVDVAVATGTGFGVLGTAARAVGGFLAGPGGLVVAGAAVAGGLTIMAVAAENSARRIGMLRNELSLVRTDFATSSIAADQAAKHLAATSFLSTADSRSGINSVYGQGNLFTGSQAQAEQLVLVNARLSKALGETAINAARAGQIVADPAGVLASLLREKPDITAFNQQTVDQVKHLQDAGRAGEAFNVAWAALLRLTANVNTALTPLQQGIQDIEKAFTSAGQSGKTFGEDLGGPITRGIGVALTALSNLVAKLHESSEISQKAGGPSFGEFMLRGVSPMLPFGLPGSFLGTGKSAALPGPRADGSGLSTGPVSSAAGMVTIKSPGGASFTVAASAAPAFQGLINELEGSGYRIDTTSSYRPGATVAGTGAPSMHASGLAIDINASRNGVGTQGDIPPALARELAAKYGVKWGGDFRNPDPMHFGYDGMARPNGTPASMAGAVGGPHGDTTDARVAEAAKPLADASTEAGRQELLTKKSQLEAALQLPGLDDAHVKEYGQALDDIRKKIEDAIPAGDALERSLQRQTSGEARIAEAWRNGAAAAERVTERVKAEAEARQHYATDSAQYAALADRLTDAYHRQAVAQTELVLAEKSSQNADSLKYLNAEISTLGMDANARELALAHMKAELELRRQFPAATDAMIAKMVAESDQLTANSQKLRDSQQALRELDGLASSALDKFSDAITEPLKEGETAGQRFGSVMVSVFKDIEKEVLKMAVINPILNSLGLGPHRSTFTDLFSGLGGSSTTGTGTTSTAGGAGSPSTFLGSIGSGIGKLLGGGNSGGGIDSAISNAYSGSWLQSIFGGGSASAASAASAGVDASGAAMSTSGAIGGVSEALPMVYHQGGLVGFDAVPSRYVHPAYFDSAPRFHAGLGGDEFAAILQKGERVLTERQQGQVAAASKGGGNAGHTFNITVPGTMDTDAARRTGTQIGMAAVSHMSRMTQRNQP